MRSCVRRAGRRRARAWPAERPATSASSSGSSAPRAAESPRTRRAGSPAAAPTSVATSTASPTPFAEEPSPGPSKPRSRQGSRRSSSRPSRPTPSEEGPVARSRSGTRGRRGPRKPPRREGAFGASVQTIDPRERGAIELPATITVKELADLFGVNPADVIRELIKSGIFATINQLIDRDTAALVAGELGYEVAEPVAAAGGDGAEDGADGAVSEASKEELFTEVDDADLVTRAPIVTVMGHVDHGKTSLLDAIRSTTVAAGERGGITQHIGASEVTKDGRRVVFLDTPGHEAFTAMRARGARVTDIAIVVVAADDGVMPQTLEAISHAKAAKVPIIIALNKMDKPDANPDRVKTELTEAGVVVEEYGGDTPLVPVSAKSRMGLDDLVEMVLLVADLQDLKANPKRSAIGTIVEARMDKSRGAVATALVQTGTLRVGDVIVVGETFGRVRALENETGKRIPKAGPATAAVVLGLSEVPEAGDILRVVADEKEARAMVEARSAQIASKGGEGSGRATLEDLYKQIQAGQAKELRIILKADVSGSLGAITHALGQLATDEVKINVLHEGAGEITDNDILLASASNAIVVGFNTRISDTARRAAETEKVDVRLYDIIYQLTDDIEKALSGLLEPELVEVIEGRAEVRQIIKVGKSQVIAGSYVTDGRIVRGGARVWRGGKVVATDRIESLRRFRDDVREVATGFECGIALAGFNDLQEGDVIECYTSQMVSRSLAS
ncbi:MAG: translation initiation factor IF-2 [Chloroflexota bacterium]|nr:MAG: translation initiation factor IF-2 [Chloroflexota bacterium]